MMPSFPRTIPAVLFLGFGFHPSPPVWTVLLGVVSAKWIGHDIQRESVFARDWETSRRRRARDCMEPAGKGQATLPTSYVKACLNIFPWTCHFPLVSRCSGIYLDCPKYTHDLAGDGIFPSRQRESIVCCLGVESGGLLSYRPALGTNTVSPLSSPPPPTWE